jgi:hypothetical protein
MMADPDMIHLENPPLVEVVVRLGPSRAWLDLHDLQTICRLTSALRKRLPEARFLEDHHPPSAPFIPVQIEGLLSGLRFSGRPDGISLTVLPQLIFVQWENRALGEPQDYPHFGALEDLLTWAVDIIRQTAGSSALPSFKLANISYTNFVPTQTRPSWQDVRRYLVPEAIPACLEDSALCNEVNLSWKNDEGRDHRLLVRALRSGEDMPRGFELVAAAGRFLDPAQTWPQDDLRANHEALKKLFRSVITRQARQEWRWVDG